MARARKPRAAAGSGARKTPAKSPGPPPVALVAQPHGGALRQGGTNRGGTGRPPHLIRDHWRALLDKYGSTLLENLLKGQVALQTKCPKCDYEPKTKVRLPVEVPEQLRALEMLARYGVGFRDEITAISPEVRLRVQQTVAIVATEGPGLIRETETPEAAIEALLARLDEVWQ